MSSDWSVTRYCFTFYWSLRRSFDRSVPPNGTNLLHRSSDGSGNQYAVFFYWSLRGSFDPSLRGSFDRSVAPVKGNFTLVVISVIRLAREAVLSVVLVVTSVVRSVSVTPNGTNYYSRLVVTSIIQLVRQPASDILSYWSLPGSFGRSVGLVKG